MITSIHVFFFVRSKRLSSKIIMYAILFLFEVNVFPSIKGCISDSNFHVFYASRRFLSSSFFSDLRFPQRVRPRQLLCWRRPRWFSTSSDLCFLSLSLSLSQSAKQIFGNYFCDFSRDDSLSMSLLSFPFGAEKIET